jgi:hypothetical protein
MALRMEHAPVATKEDGDEEGRLCAMCKQNCYFSFVAWCAHSFSHTNLKSPCAEKVHMHSSQATHTRPADAQLFD